MQEATFRHRLDIYYLATIGYGITLAAYTVIQGTMTAEKFEVVWKDPIVYLLAACAIAALVALIVAAISGRTVIVGERTLKFKTRFREREFKPEEIEWIGFRRERRFREERAYPSARIKLRTRRRLLRLRPASFERSGELETALGDWARNNGVELKLLRAKRSRRRKNGESQA
ncbi:MAG: hypothetical protein JWQ98_1597 [Chlorobi bacterium]|nr:hypothetical protein [Chlorobiota bacterium]